MIGVSSCGRLVVYIYAYVYIHVMGSQLPGRLICVRTYGWLYAWAASFLAVSSVFARTDGCMHACTGMHVSVCVCVPYFAHMLFEVVCKHTSVAS